MDMKNITLTDIAQELNLSRSTIDRVLNDRGNVAVDTKKRVLRYINELGYKPNRAAKHLAKRTNCSIGVSYYLPNEFALQINRGINTVYEELSNYGLNVLIRAADSPEEQLLQIKEMSEQIDALALAVWEPDLVGDLVNDLIDDGLPVATFNRDLPDSERLFYFGCNYFESGQVCGGIIKKITSKPGKIAIINNHDILGEYRAKGFKSVLSDNFQYDIIGPYEICEEFEVEGSINEKVIEDIQRIIKDNPDLVAIYVANQTLCAAGKAVELLGKQGEIKLVGFDLYEQTVSLIEKDIIQAVVCQEPFNQGYYPIKILFELIAEGKEIEKSKFITRLEIVMKENLRYYHNYDYIK
ncbi:LacI family DNA-binding transcriptional regulator [Halocella sp. SP3-1]|uniref:LacI family DNA-binding transcriptional regulator n=1 Tax=Halocella sp. SP3-1 TaxID=2382161 RepID=UPI000F75D533|nr:LacI family DNA-binding transcriptional regulator [Halocella sp. SP3-1]AZO95771.1 LacI family DNA-binding transcriptional regulator [Halocella sp. SP3-1]